MPGNVLGQGLQYWGLGEAKQTWQPIRRGRCLLNYHTQLCATHSVLTPSRWSLPAQLGVPMHAVCSAWKLPRLAFPMAGSSTFSSCGQISSLQGNKPLRTTPVSPLYQCSVAARPGFIFLHITYHHPMWLMCMFAYCLFPALNVRSVKAGALSVLLTPMNSAWHGVTA